MAIDLDQARQNLLRKLPGVDRMLEYAKDDLFYENVPKTVLVRSIRKAIEEIRRKILTAEGPFTEHAFSSTVIIERVKNHVQAAVAMKLGRVVNATGVVVHTNLGRSLLAKEAVENLSNIAASYSNLEFDLSLGKRGSRYACVEDILCELTGAESAMVVNNNAGAVLLCLETIAKGKKVIVSRGELVEIGGSFRIPDVMEKSGAFLKEVGTTNRTHLRDYRDAIDEDTGLFLKVHKSNYSIVGFSAEIPLKELVSLGQEHQIPVMEDLGSGTFIDFSKYGLPKEPTVQESVADGADIVTFSGDKLLGGPQAGLIVGKKTLMEKIKKNPITRALRIDKLTLAALEGTLHIYRNPRYAVEAIPTLRMMLVSLNLIEQHAQRLADCLARIDDARLSVRLVDLFSKVGGGAFPLLNLPSKGIGVQIEGMSANVIESALRRNRPPVIGRIEGDIFVMDLRTLQNDDFQIIAEAFVRLLEPADYTRS